MIPNIGLFDICLGTILLISFFFFTFKYKNRIATANIPFSYFIIASTAKFIGAITFVLLSLFYFKAGDTFLYFEIAEELRTHLFINPTATIKLLFTPYDGLQALDYHPLQVYNYYYERSTTWAFSRIVFFFNLISMGSYLVSSLLISLVSFIGLWSGYRSLTKLYPATSKWMLIPFFLIPTATIWSSGILKDTLLMGSIGLLITIGINLFIYKTKIVTNIIYFSGCTVILIGLKPILVLTLIPCVIFWGGLHYTHKIKKQRLLLRLSFITTIFLCTYLISFNLPKNSKYKFNNLTTTLIAFQQDHANNKQANTTYTLGDIKFGYINAIKKMPQAIGVTFFRPLIVEVKNAPMLIAAFEALALLLFFILTIVRSRKKIINLIFTNYELLFFLSFAIIYGFITGLSAFNFGALSRFKIPAVMFFMIGLAIIHIKYKNKKYTSTK